MCPREKTKFADGKWSSKIVNDSVHLKLIDFLSRSLDLFLKGLDETKFRKLSRSQHFQVALIARVHERGDAVLTLLREDRDHSTGELVRSVLEAHATLVFLKKARKARFRLEIESVVESIKLLTRMVANPQVSIDDKVEAKRILKEKVRRKEVLFSKGIRKATKSRSDWVITACCEGCILDALG